MITVDSNRRPDGKAPRGLVAVAPFFARLIPLAGFAHDLRVTFGAMALVMGLLALVLRLRRTGLIADIALWVAAAACVAAVFLFASHPHL
jgi:hypothetical protein